MLFTMRRYEEYTWYVSLESLSDPIQTINPRFSLTRGSTSPSFGGGCVRGAVRMRIRSVHLVMHQFGIQRQVQHGTIETGILIYLSIAGLLRVAPSNCRKMIFASGTCPPLVSKVLGATLYGRTSSDKPVNMAKFVASFSFEFMWFVPPKLLTLDGIGWVSKVRNLLPCLVSPKDHNIRCTCATWNPRFARLIRVIEKGHLFPWFPKTKQEH